MINLSAVALPTLAVIGWGAFKYGPSLLESVKGLL
jgi:hypothetical protein